MKTITTGAVAALLATAAGAGTWGTNTEKDPMTGKTATYSTIRSNNSLSLDSPYSGSNYGHITVRKHPKYGQDVIVQFEQGQTMCRSYEPCRVAVKFDDNKPITFTGYPPADHGTTSIFLEPESKFIANASKAKKILVQFQVYRHGDQIFEFSTSTPLKWEPAK